MDRRRKILYFLLAFTLIVLLINKVWMKKFLVMKCKAQIPEKETYNWDSFHTALQRHFQRSGTGQEKQFPVAWTYEKYKITGNLSCWAESKFSPLKEQNMRIVQSYPLGDSCIYLEEIGLLKPYNKLTPPDVPIVVTGASSNHFLESQAFLYNIKTTLMQNYKVPKLIYYDLGLDTLQRKELEQYCDCEIRNFPFHKYPSHVKTLQGYAWKPLIIQTVLNEYGYVLWLDTSIRFIKTSLFQDLMRNVDTYGIASFEFKYTIGAHIDPETLEFLGEDPCLFSNASEPGGGGVIVRRSHFTLEYIMRPWVSCALTYGCMVNDRSSKLGGCPDKPSLGSCQRFDQAVLGVILWRLYGRIELVIFPEMLVIARRAHEMKYFYMLREKKLKSTTPALAVNIGDFTYAGTLTILLLINRLITMCLRM